MNQVVFRLAWQTRDKMDESYKKKIKSKTKYLRDGDLSSTFFSTNTEYRVKFTLTVFVETYSTFLQGKCSQKELSMITYMILQIIIAS